MARYPVNQPVSVNFTDRDRTGALVDAGALTTLVKIQNADGTYTTTGTYTPPTRDSLGTYHQDIPVADLQVLGHYAWTVTATGTGASVAFGDFDVFDPFAEESVQPATDYATIEELKQRLSIFDTTDDAQMAIAVSGASRAIEGATGRYFWKGADTRTYVPESIWSQTIDDLVTVTTLKTDQDGDGVFETTWTAGTDYELALGDRSYNISASGEQRPYTQVKVISGGKLFPFTWAFSRQDRIQVAGTFGWPAIPVTIRQVTLQLAAELFKLKDAPFGVVSFADLGVVRVQQNPQMYTLLQPYIRGARKVGV